MHSLEKRKKYNIHITYQSVRVYLYFQINKKYLKKKTLPGPKKCIGLAEVDSISIAPVFDEP